MNGALDTRLSTIVNRLQEAVDAMAEAQRKLNIQLALVRISELEERLQDLYDWGPGENAPPAAKAAWDRAHATLHNEVRSE